MAEQRKFSPWLWIPSLFAAEEIPSAVVIFVSLVMFLQFGAGETLAAVYAGLLFLPWMLKSYLYTKVRKAESFRWRIHLVELLMLVCLMSVAFYINDCRVKVWVLFLLMFALSTLCAWHELLSRLYFNRMLAPREQQIYGTTKMLSSQMSLIVTYGVLIIAAGFFEVFFRSYKKAWAMESALVAGGFLIFCVVNAMVLSDTRAHHRHRHESIAEAVQNEWHVIERIRRKPKIGVVVASLFFMLLPQALMFNTRVFFLFASASDGGLDCSVQDVGFAQGTIGVIAFSLGLACGRWLTARSGERTFWFTSRALTLSPVFYMLMAHCPQPGNLLLICCMTFLAQLFFGFGLNACRPFVGYVSGRRYSNTVNFLYVPLVAGVMFVPLMLSGWLSAMCGYEMYFTLCAAMAPVAWIVLEAMKTKDLFNNAQTHDK